MPAASLSDIRPVICLVTDRRRLAPGRPAAAQRDRLVAQVRAAACAGVTLVQLRERDLDGRPLLDLTRACVEAVDGTPARVLVNDRLDVALAGWAHGIHLRSDSFDAGRARALAPPGFLVARAVHGRDEAVRIAERGACDCVVFGTVFATLSKAPGAPLAGIEGLAGVAAAVRVPVLAIGGIGESTLRAVASTGAAGVAAVGLFVPDDIDDDRALEDRVARAVAAVRQAFV